MVSERLSPEAKRDAERFVLEQSNCSIDAVAHKVRMLGVDQYIRDNGWGNLEWQTRSLLKGMEKRGLIRFLEPNRGMKFESVRTLQ